MTKKNIIVIFSSGKMIKLIAAKRRSYVGVRRAPGKTEDIGVGVSGVRKQTHDVSNTDSDSVVSKSGVSPEEGGVNGAEAVKTKAASAAATTFVFAACSYIWYACYRLLTKSRIQSDGYKPREYGDFYTR